MTLIAINVLLDPDAATVEKARATNARLREDYYQVADYGVAQRKLYDLHRC